MTFNERITAAWPEKEILKYAPPNNTPVRSVVVDATSIALPTDRNARIIVPGGTLMRRTADNKRVVPFDGTGKIEGVLKSPVEILSNTTAGYTTGALYFTGCIFITTAIPSFLTYASNVTTDLVPFNNRFEGA